MASKRKEPNSLGLNDSCMANVQKNKTFTGILQKIKKVDFIKEIYKFGGIERPSAKHYRVIAIKKLIELGIGFRNTNSNIYIYNSAYWEIVSHDEFKHFLGEVALKMGINKFDCTHYRSKNELLSQFISDAYTDIPEVNNDIVHINLINGTLEINNGIYKMKPFDKNDFLTYQLSFAYDQNATAPIFGEYLSRVLPDSDVQAVLAEYLGYLFMRNGSGIKIEKMLGLKGDGANGKSVLYEILMALLGIENVTNYSLDLLTDDNGYYRAEIGGKLLNYSSETKGRINEAIFKQLASGEAITARSPYEKPFQLSTFAKTIVNLNSDIKSVEHVNAYFRRFILIPFNVTIPEAEQDKELHHKIINAELPGVLNWIFQGLDRLLANKKLTYSKVIEDEITRFKTESNSVALFLQEKIFYVADCKTPSKNVYSEYVAFCVTDGYKKVSHIEFNRRLKQLHLNKKKIEVWKMKIGQVVNITNTEIIYNDPRPVLQEEIERLKMPF